MIGCSGLMVGWKDFTEKLGRAYKAMAYHLSQHFVKRE